MWNRRITKACFRICSTCRSHSQALLCLCTPRLVTNQPERTIARLRYILGGDRPSQTARLTMSQGRLHGSWLDTQQTKGGISRLAPRGLAPPLQSLPPILHMLSRVPMSGYSKGAQGLSVQTRVSGIFTAATVSPSSSRRQCPDRYTIRAGRNLPDKEFRSSWSPCRHGARTISSTRFTEPAGVWPLRIPKRTCDCFGLSC
jgi:hypothetical protein